LKNPASLGGYDMRPISAMMKNVKSSNFNSASKNYLPGQE
jgi:hypothetical protein